MLYSGHMLDTLTETVEYVIAAYCQEPRCERKGRRCNQCDRMACGQHGQGLHGDGVCQRCLLGVGGKMKRNIEQELLAALKAASEIIEIARQYFPKSIHNSDKFQLENTCATVKEAICKVQHAPRLEEL